MKYSFSEKFSKAKTLISKIQNILKIPKCLSLEIFFENIKSTKSKFSNSSLYLLLAKLLLKCKDLLRKKLWFCFRTINVFFAFTFAFYLMTSKIYDEKIFIFSNQQSRIYFLYKRQVFLIHYSKDTFYNIEELFEAEKWS